MRAVLTLAALVVLPAAAHAATQPPVTSDPPCTWSQRPDGTYVCRGNIAPLPGGAQAATGPQCRMIFTTPANMAGLRITFVRPRPRGGPFAVEDVTPPNTDNSASTYRWVWAATLRRNAQASCPFVFEVRLPKAR